MTIIRNFLVAVALALAGVCVGSAVGVASVAAPPAVVDVVDHVDTASAYVSNCGTHLNGNTEVWTQCFGGAPPWIYVQTWIKCSNAPTVVIRGNRISSEWVISVATCPSGAYVVWRTFAYWT